MSFNTKNMKLYNFKNINKSMYTQYIAAIPESDINVILKFYFDILRILQPCLPLWKNYDYISWRGNT